MNPNNPFNNPALDENGNYKKFSLLHDTDVSYSNHTEPLDKPTCWNQSIVIEKDFMAKE